MSFRDDVSVLAQELKKVHKMTYTDMCNDSGMTRKQVASILLGNRGVSLEKIEHFFESAFGERLEGVLFRD